ncbi:hypothetical protein T492DRAFT_1078113, partial [Pavlovales sp. CCMP2436]
MHMMSILKNTAAALALCAAWRARVGLRVSEMRPEDCVCKRALAPLHPTPPRRARAACTMCARDGCEQTEWVAALRCTSIGRICALAVTGSARTASLGPIALSASALGAIPWSMPPICAVSWRELNGVVAVIAGRVQGTWGRAWQFAPLMCETWPSSGQGGFLEDGREEIGIRASQRRWPWDARGLGAHFYDRSAILVAAGRRRHRWTQ